MKDLRANELITNPERGRQVEMGPRKSEIAEPIFAASFYLFLALGLGTMAWDKWFGGVSDFWHRVVFALAQGAVMVAVVALIVVLWVKAR